MIRRIVDVAIGHARLTIAILIFLLVAGASAYINVPKEASPDVTIPIIYVSMSARGISPEDSERLLVRPMETALKSIGNIKEMRSAGFEGGGFVLLEFEAGFNPDVALADVRAKVDDAKRELPADADEPGVHEVNLSLFPVVIVTLGGDVSDVVDPPDHRHPHRACDDRDVGCQRAFLKDDALEATAVVIEQFGGSKIARDEDRVLLQPGSRFRPLRLVPSTWSSRLR